MAVAKPTESRLACSTRPLSISLQKLNPDMFPQLHTRCRNLTKLTRGASSLQTQSAATDSGLSTPAVQRKRTRSAPKRLVLDSAAVKAEMLQPRARLKHEHCSTRRALEVGGNEVDTAKSLDKQRRKLRPSHARKLDKQRRNLRPSHARKLDKPESDRDVAELDQQCIGPNNTVKPDEQDGPENETRPGDAVKPDEQGNGSGRGDRECSEAPTAEQPHPTAESLPPGQVGGEKTSRKTERMRVVVRCRSPPNTRQSTVAGRVRRQSRKCGPAAAHIAAVRRVRIKNSSSAVVKGRKRKRVMSVSFLSGSDVGSEAEGARTREAGEGRRKVGRPPLKKRRRLSSSAQETSGEGPTEASGHMVQETVPESLTVSAPSQPRRGGARGEEGWTCTSDEDDLAVSKRLEELQRERGGDVFVSEIGERVEVLPLTCSAPNQIVYIYQTNVEGDVSTGGVMEGSGGEGGGGGSGCINVANLEINPSSIITDYECATQPEVDSKTELFESESNRVSVCIEKHLQTGGCRLQFGAGRPRHQTTTQPRRSRAAVLPSTSDSSPDEKTMQRLPRSRKVRETGEQKPKRQRGRPRKSSSDRGGARERRRKSGSECNAPRGRGVKLVSEPKRPRGRPRKKGGGKPSSLPVRRDSGSPPQGSPQNGEDSGYPCSISSSSSQGPKSLKSPPDVSPSFNFPAYFTSTSTVADKNEAPHLPPPSSSRPPPVLEQQCRGSINTAELGLFSPDVVDDAHIANFPMPPDPEWVWSAMGVVRVDPTGAESDGLLGHHHYGGGGLDSASETTTQSLFDPSKMVIAKVESLSDDSRFNDYLNEILGSEEVMECLNSISVEPFPVVPMEPKQIGLAPTKEVSSGSQVTVLAASGGADDKGVESAVVTVTTSSTAVIESSQPTAVPPVSAGVCTSGSIQSSSETVAAYVAAETSVIPFSVGDCFTAPEVNVVTAAAEAVAPLASLAQEILPTRPKLITNVPSTLASLRCGDLAPKSNVMWSQSGAVEEPSLKPPETSEMPPLEIQHKSTSGSPVCESSGEVLQGTVHQHLAQSTPVVPTATRTASNSGESVAPPLQPPAEPLQEKKQIVRIKRRKVVKTAPESDKNEGKVVKTASESSMSSGEAGEAAASLKEGGRGLDKKDEVSKPQEVKSRTGRAIKPSWKVAQQASSTQGLKCTNSPSTKASVLPTNSNGEGGDDVRAGDRVGKVVKKGRPRIVKTSTAKKSSATSSLSLADVVGGGGLKKLPDLPANTLVSPNPTISLPTTSGTLSMSLDDILRQMNDDESQGVSEPAAGSLLPSTGGAGPTINDGEDGEERATEVPLKEEERSERGASRILVKPAIEFPSPIRWTEDDSTSPVPQTAAQHREPGITSEASGVGSNPMPPPPSARDIHLQMRGKTAETAGPRSPDYIKRPLNPFMLHKIDRLGPTGVDDSPRLSGVTLPNLLVEPDEEDDCCAVMMDLSSSGDEAEPMPRTPSAPPPEECRELLSLSGLRTPSHTPPEASGETLDEGAQEEDRIDIFADDVDAFTVYTMEEKAKNATPPRMPSPPRITSPRPKFPTKPSVRNWVRSQNSVRRISTDSHRQENHLSFPLTPTVPSHHLQRSFSATPLPPSFPRPPLFPPQHPHHHHQPQPLFPAHIITPGCDASFHRRQGRTSSCSSSSPATIQPLFLPSKPCWSFLRGHCSFNPCKFSHAPLSSYPLPQLESILMRLPPDAVPVDVSEHYVTRATAKPQNWFPQLVKLVKGLTNRNWDTAMQAYSTLVGNGVLLRPQVLSRLLGLMREQTQPMLSAFVPLPQLARGILQEIRDQGPCNLEDYHTVLRILNTAQQPVQLMEVYMSMRQDGLQTTREILHLVLRGSSSTDERLLQLLNDSKTCLSVSNDVARIANGVLEKVGPQLVSGNLLLVEEWLSGASEILDIMGKESILKLFSVLVSGQRWSSLLTMLEGSPKTVLGLESRVCCPLSEILLRQPTLSNRAILVLEMMSDEALASFPPEGWNAVLAQCVLPATPQRTAKFCRVVSHSKKCLDQEALDAVLEMSMSQDLSSAATEIVANHLHFVPPVVPSQDILGKLCSLLHQEGQHQNLFTIVERLLQCRVAPSPPILQSFLDSCRKEGSYGQLAAVVKRAREWGLRLEKIFYQRALVLLRPWGQDQAAISDIYKAIRAIDTGCSSFSPFSKSVSSGAPGVMGTSQGPSDFGGRGTPASQGSRSSGGPTSSSGRSGKSSTKSLEYIYEQTTEPSPAVKPGIIALLESNGRQGQFGAAVSILRNLCDASSSAYSNTVVHAVWSSVTNSDQKPPNAFSSLLEHLAGPPSSSGSSGSLPPCDSWLASQLGIALLKMYAETEHWQSGFVMLHHLHRHKIDYFAHRTPFAPLPPLKPPQPSLLGLARMAINTCLRVDSPDFAVQVMKGCRWASECGPSERQAREQLVVTVAQRCLNSALYEDCYSCLRALDSVSTKNKRFTSVAQLYNRLLASALGRSKADVDLGTRVYRTMNSSNFPCLPSNLSLLTAKLCDLLQFSTARDLCEQAIDQNFYAPITHGEPFSVFLPPSIHHVEVCSLLKRHLHRLSGELEGKLLQPLTITFEGSRSHVEEGLNKGLTPPLAPVFTSSSDSTTVATVSPSALFTWLHAHFPSSHFLLERDLQPRRGNRVTRKVRRGEIQGSLGEALEREGQSTGSQGGPSTATASTTEERGEPEPPANNNLDHAVPKQPALTAARSKQRFRVELCRLVVAEVKPFYKAKRFNSYEDYLHLVKRLTTHLSKTTRTSISNDSAKSTLDDDTRRIVKDLVQSVMSQCTVYSPESKLQLES